MALADLMRLSLRERRTRGFFLWCVAGNPGETATCAAFLRELQNFIERAVILSPHSVLRAPTSELQPFHAHNVAEMPITVLEEVKRDHILRALEASNWVV